MLNIVHPSERDIMFSVAKICKKCGIEKPVEEFYPYTVYRFNKSLGGKKAYTYRQSVCARCASTQFAQWSKKNDRSGYYDTYHEVHIERERAYGRAYNKSPHGRDVRNGYERTRRTADPLFRLSRNTGRSLRSALGSAKVGRHWEVLLGYTAEKLKKHLEFSFEPGMTWENYGKWHVDHVIPKSWFVYSSSQDLGFKICWALENLQPMWAKENVTKLNRWVS